MIDELGAYASGAELEADICVVGAGAAGLAIAREFLGTRTTVLVVESGGLTSDDATDRLMEGEVEGIGEDALVAGRARGFGGSTALWAGQCIPLSEIDFEARDWVEHSGWPLARDALAPYYARAAELLGVEGEPYGESLWERRRAKPPALDPARLGHTYTAWSPRPHLGRVLRHEFRRAANVRVLLHANAASVVTDPDRTAFAHLEVRGLDGRSARIRARACVLCGGGIENARVLLVSGDPEAGGLGNARGNVGRYFQDHPNVHCARVRTDSPRVLQEAYSLFYRRRRRYLPKIALAPEVQRAERVLNCAANLEYEFADESLNALRRLYRGLRRGGERAEVRRDLPRAARGAPAAGAAAYRRLVRGRATAAAPAAIWLQAHAEQAPNPDSRVVLGRERDAVGVNVARVEWRLGDLERRTAATMARVVGDELARLGLASLEPPDWLLDPDSAWRDRFGDSYHHLGTTRMSREPAHGVVDPDCRVHGLAGVYVGGGSVFPTSGYANPTLTIVALAIRLADHLRTAAAA